MLGPCGALVLPAAPAGHLCLVPRLSSFLRHHRLSPHQSRPLLSCSSRTHSPAPFSTSAVGVRGPVGPGKAGEGGRPHTRPGASRMSAVSGTAASSAQAAKDGVIPGAERLP